jgi:beta-mannosidase
VALVTINDTDPAVVKAAQSKEGTGALTMMFRVNGAAVYARGGSMVPMDLMNGRLSAAAHRRVVQSAAEGNMNMLRIWGGAVYMPPAFYEACDDFGVMLYHDMQFTGKAGSVTFSHVVEAEIEHNAQCSHSWFVHYGLHALG